MNAATRPPPVLSQVEEILADLRSARSRVDVLETENKTLRAIADSYELDVRRLRAMNDDLSTLLLSATQENDRLRAAAAAEQLDAYSEVP